MTSPAARTHLVTGGTGVLGSSLIVELLRARPQDRAICVVRASSTAEAQQLLDASIGAAADAQGGPVAQLPALWRRVTAVAGDLARPGLALQLRDRQRLLASGPLSVWHTATGSPRTGGRLAHHSTAVERIMELAKHTQLAVFNHISTAYVAGCSTIGRETLTRPRQFMSRYEQLCHAGEEVVHDACCRAGVPYRILRPSLVVGNSRTGRATAHDGVLVWALKLAALNELVSGALARRPISYVANPHAELNVIPIDSVVEDCVGIDEAGSGTHNRVFHLTNTAAPTVSQITRIVARALGLCGIHFCSAEAELDVLSKKFHSWTAVDRPYGVTMRTFSRHDSNGLYASSRHGYCPLDEQVLEQMIRSAISDAGLRRVA